MTGVDESAFGKLLSGINRAYAQGDPTYLDKGPEAANVEFLQNVFRRLLEGPPADLAACLTDDVEFEWIGLPAWNIHVRGRDEVLAAIHRNFSSVSKQEPVIRNLVAQGDEIAMWIEEEGTLREGGASYHLHAVQWFTFRGGKIARIREVIGSSK